jgi:hypothetical protein
MAGTSWYLKGDRFEICNGDVLCPCIHDVVMVPTQGCCDVALALHIGEEWP